MQKKPQRTEFSQADALFERLSTEKKLQVATLAGGCFWCLQAPFEQQDGVAGTIAGYAGGRRLWPTYEQVTTGVTGHRESVQVFFDAQKITYSHILSIYWLQIDVADAGGQFADRGVQYTTAIFYHSDAQHSAAQQSQYELQKSLAKDQTVATEIIPFSNFFPAEDYHQQFYKKQPDVYYRYKLLSGRGR